MNPKFENCPISWTNALRYALSFARTPWDMGAAQITSLSLSLSLYEMSDLSDINGLVVCLNHGLGP